MRRILALATAILSLATISQKSLAQNIVPVGSELTNYVNPFVGTDAHGHTYPGATVPFGMVQLSPDTRLEGWDGCGGYHYSDSIVYGFSHTHLQGTGVSDYGDVLFMPTNGKTVPAEHWRDSYKSKFSHKNEKATPGYYEIKLDNYNIKARLTTTERVGIHEYTIQPGDTCRLFIDMMHRDNLKYYDIQTVGDTAIYGYRVSEAWATDQHACFYAVFSQPFTEFTQLMQRYDEILETGERNITYEEVQIFAMLFAPKDPSKPNTITVKVGWSGTTPEGALKNLQAEAP
ncbi:MAG: glycoside hydrolase family 92 protein, partial [Flavobacteriales bacterium]